MWRRGHYAMQVHVFMPCIPFLYNSKLNLGASEKPSPPPGIHHTSHHLQIDSGRILERLARVLSIRRIDLGLIFGFCGTATAILYI